MNLPGVAHPYPIPLEKAPGFRPETDQIEIPVRAWSALTGGKVQLEPFGSGPKDSWAHLTNVLLVRVGSCSLVFIRFVPLGKTSNSRSSYPCA